MKKFVIVFTVIICFFNSSLFIQAQNEDQVSGSEPIVVPENIRSLVEQITNAENNENWEEYATLREEIIQAWQQVNPEVAKLYSNSNSGKPDLTADGMPVNSDRLFNSNPPDEEYEIPMESPDWGDDVMITSERAYDISMDVNRNGEIFIAVDSGTKNIVYIYKSTDGGLTWSEWGSISATTRTFEQIELICFDHPSGTEAYILLFFKFNDGWMRVGRSDMSAPSFSYHTIVSSGVIDFAVDRNFSPSNYRAICVYDSSNRIYSTRSEPSSYGTVWQDKVNIGTYVGRDVDFAYGWNGAVYTTFNGNSTGNLYAIENTNYADPTSWDPAHTISQGAVDTTRHAEIIASREDDPNNKVIVVFERKSSPTINTYDLYDATRDNNVWTAYNTWVVPDENKWPSMSIEYSLGQDFRAAFVQSLELNQTPREIKYKGYGGSTWSGSLQMSDPSNDPTGLQKPEVGSLGTNATIVAYAGSNSNRVYFDNESWAPVGIEDDLLSQTPTEFNLSQNYPNPFNPTTNIKFSVSELSSVSLKVFNLIGEEITQLVNQELETGNYEVNFNATNLPSGIYLYKFQAGNFVETKKMVLMK